MSRVATVYARSERWPRLWRMALIAVCTLILCSCQGLRKPCPPPSGVPGGMETLPPEAYSGAPVQMPQDGVIVPTPGAGPALPSSTGPVGPWAPPGFSQPWPRDEYLADGGDRVPHAVVNADWEVRGMDLEDTVAHFDTLDGRVMVEPSNRVHIYSPRFGSVRQVVGLTQNETRRTAAGVHMPDKVVLYDESEAVESRQQHYQPEREITTDALTIYRSRQGDGEMSTTVKPKGFHEGFKVYEDFAAIREGKLDHGEMGWLARSVQAAITWASDLPVQVFINQRAAAASVGEKHVETVFSIDEPPAHPKLRLIKVASTPYAEPGDTVEFTLRFDNVGNEPIGNVTILDNLTTRLEYVADSAECSVPAEFLSEVNQGESLALRWEITDPLKPGEGGIIRFTCRVR